MNTKLWMIAAILICGASVFTSCSSDDNPVKPIIPAKDLLYQWVVDYDVEDIEGNGITVDHAVKVYEFFADGTGYYEYYLLNKGELEFVEYLRGFNGEFTYTVSNNIVTIKLLDEFDELEPIWKLTYKDGHLIDPDDKVFRHSTDAEHDQILEWYTMWTTTPPDLNVAEKVIGKWIVDEKDGEPALTNQKLVINFESANKVSVSLSYMNFWHRNDLFDYTIDGNVISCASQLDEHTFANIIVKVNAIDANKMYEDFSNIISIDGVERIKMESKETLKRITDDYSASILGMWEGRSTGAEGSEFDDGEDHRWEYLGDGTFRYYHKVEGQWQLSNDVLNDYFVAGNLLCTRWKNAGEGQEENREWWEIESIKDDVMKWKALRKKADGSTYTATFEMKKVQ